MLETREVRSSGFAIDCKGRLKNIHTGNYWLPTMVKGNPYYSTVSGAAVRNLVKEAWEIVDFITDSDWYLAVKEFVMLRKAIRKAQSKTKKQKRLELAEKGYWGAEIEAPPDLEWKTHIRYPKVEISETGLLRQKNNRKKAFRPALQNLHPIFRNRTTQGYGQLNLTKVYRELYRKPLPDFEDVSAPEDAIIPEFNFECPYKRDMIQTLYGSGKPDAQFSPLDWQHDQLPEAVMMRV